MADSKVSQLPVLASPASNDEIYIVDSSSTPTASKITLYSLFGNIPVNTSITGTVSISGNVVFSGARNTVAGNTAFDDIDTFNLRVSGNTITIKNSYTPANSTAGLQHHGGIAWDATYLYVQTSNTAWKRVALTTF